MAAFISHSPYTDPVQAVILDWAGTAVDYGCVGPAAVFVRVFDDAGIGVSTTEARQFMGLEKKAHIRAMLQIPAVAAQWKRKNGRLPDEDDATALYAQTEPMMVAAIRDHADPINGLLAFVAGMRQRDIKIGSCTGYTKPMMDVLVPAAAEKGYSPDCVVCSSDVPAGRPLPWMCYRNAIELQTYPFEAMIKIGDTISDIEEGRNAGMWTIGLTQSGNELGLTEDEVDALPPEALDRRLETIEATYRQAGANFVARGIWECLDIVDEVSARLKKGGHPLHGSTPSKPLS